MSKTTPIKLACIAVFSFLIFSLPLLAQTNAPAKTNKKIQMAVPTKGAKGKATTPMSQEAPNPEDVAATLNAPAKRFTFTLGASGGMPYADKVVSTEKIGMAGLHLSAAYHGIFKTGFLQKMGIVTLLDGGRFLAETIPAWAMSAQAGLTYSAWAHGKHSVAVLATGGYAGGMIDNKNNFGMGLAELGMRYQLNFNQRWGLTTGLRQQFFIDDGHFFLGTQILVGANYEI